MCRLGCGNGQCEVGEACTSAACHPGCAMDCPPYAGTCPLGLTSSGDVSECSGSGNCAQGSGKCVCFTGYTGSACGDCDAAGYIRLVRGGPCIFIPGAIATCTDGVKDGNELGVDCGGPNCGPCPASLSRYIHIGEYASGAVAGVTALVVLLYTGRQLLQRWRNDGSQSSKAASVYPAPVRKKLSKEVGSTRSPKRQAVAPVQRGRFNARQRQHSDAPGMEVPTPLNPMIDWSAFSQTDQPANKKADKSLIL